MMCKVVDRQKVFRGDIQVAGYMPYRINNISPCQAILFYVRSAIRSNVSR